MSTEQTQVSKPELSEEQKILEQNGKAGVALFKRGVTQGKKGNQSASPDQFSKDVSSILASVVKESEQSGYVSPTKTDLLANVQSKLPLAKDPSYNDARTCLKTFMKYYKTLEKPAKQPKPDPSSKPST